MLNTNVDEVETDLQYVNCKGWPCDIFSSYSSSIHPLGQVYYLALHDLYLLLLAFVLVFSYWYSCSSDFFVPIYCNGKKHNGHYKSNSH